MLKMPIVIESPSHYLKIPTVAWTTDEHRSKMVSLSFKMPRKRIRNWMTDHSNGKVSMIHAIILLSPLQTKEKEKFHRATPSKIASKANQYYSSLGRTGPLPEG